jgi:D-alanyl-D-alanine carboxypeptidase
MRPADLHAELYRVGQQTVQRLGVPGATVSLRLDGAQVFTAAFGSADLNGDVPLLSGALFPIYSVTKLLISAALLVMVGDSRLQLDDELATLLPDLQLPVGVTVRQTLNHTAGFPDYGHLAAYQQALKTDPARPWSVSAFLEQAPPSDLLFPPGQGWAYSNIGYLLLRVLAERLSGQPLGHFLRERLFSPAGLRATCVADDLAGMQKLTPGYSTLWSDSGKLHNVVPRYHPGWVAHGLVLSNAAELAQLTESVFAGQCFDHGLVPEMLAAVEVNAQHPVFARPAYGLGVMRNGAEPDSLSGHGGGGPGFSSGVLSLPGPDGRRATASALVNQDLGDAGLILARELGTALLSLLAR